MIDDKNDGCIEWDVCPRCESGHTKGSPPLPESLRQQSEIGVIGTVVGGVPGAVFNVSYRAHCTVCGWSYNYDHEFQFKLETIP